MTAEQREQLVQAAFAVGVNVHGLTDRELALGVLAAHDVDVAQPAAPRAHDFTPIEQHDDEYIAARAVRVVEADSEYAGRVARRAEADTMYAGRITRSSDYAARVTRRATQ